MKLSRHFGNFHSSLPFEVMDSTRKRELEAQIFKVRLDCRHLSTRLRNRRRAKDEKVAFELQLKHLKRKEKFLWNALTGVALIPAGIDDEIGVEGETSTEDRGGEHRKPSTRPPLAIALVIIRA